MRCKPYRWVFITSRVIYAPASYESNIKLLFKWKQKIHNVSFSKEWSFFSLNSSEVENKA